MLLYNILDILYLLQTNLCQVAADNYIHVAQSILLDILF